METKTILERYSKYYDYLKILGKAPLSETPIIDRLKMAKGHIQHAYQEIRDDDFSGSLIDYLCWVSTQYIMHMAAKRDRVEFVCESLDDYPEEINNLLRLFIKNPSYILEGYDPDNFSRLALIWYRLYSQQK